MRVAEFHPWWETGDKEIWCLYSDDPHIYIFRNTDGSVCIIERGLTPSNQPTVGDPHDCQRHTVWVTWPQDLRWLGNR